MKDNCGVEGKGTKQSYVSLYHNFIGKIKSYTILKVQGTETCTPTLWLKGEMCTAVMNSMVRKDSESKAGYAKTRTSRPSRLWKAIEIV